MFPTDGLAWLTDVLNGLLGFLFGWLVDLVRNGWNWVVSQVPVVQPPAWLGTAIDGIGAVMASMGKMSYWVPVELFLPVVLAVFGALAVGLGIRIARIVASFMTLGGGS